MGLFTSLFDSIPVEDDFMPETQQEAYASVLYAVVQADGNLADEEMNNLSRILIQTGLFNGVDISDLMLKANYNLLNFGPKMMIEGGLRMVSDKLRPQLFCFCAELVLADGVIAEEEEKILEYLATTAAIPEETAKKIIEVSKIRTGVQF